MTTALEFSIEQAESNRVEGQRRLLSTLRGLSSDLTHIIEHSEAFPLDTGHLDGYLMTAIREIAAYRERVAELRALKMHAIIEGQQK